MRAVESKFRKSLGCALQTLGRTAILGVVCVSLAGDGLAQAGSLSNSRHRPTRRAHAKTPPTPQPQPSAEPEAAPPAPAPPPPTPEQMPPQVPQVAWDGQYLTIISDNSTLGDILKAVRALTGADLDMPTSAARERVAARLGPAPPREVLSTLLSWTEFDYVIQASESDPNGVRSVLLTAREKSDGAANNALLAASPARSGYRRAFPGNANEEASTAPPETSSVATPNPAESATATPPSSDSVAAATPPVAEKAASPDAPVVSAEMQSAPSAVPPTADSSVSQPAPTEAEQRLQQLQGLYQQRRQMIEDSRKPKTDEN
jgi:hypothetical protein